MQTTTDQVLMHLLQNPPLRDESDAEIQDPPTLDEALEVVQACNEIAADIFGGDLRFDVTAEDFYRRIRKLDLIYPVDAPSLEPLYDFAMALYDRRPDDSNDIANICGKARSALLRLRTVGSVFEYDSKAGKRTNGKPGKRTAPGDAEAKIRGALLAHHKYSNGQCKKCESIGVGQLAKLASVAKGSVTNFFNKHFADGQQRGHSQYEYACLHRPGLDASLKMLAGDMTPSILWTKLPVDDFNSGSYNRDDDN